MKQIDIRVLYYRIQIEDTLLKQVGLRLLFHEKELELIAYISILYFSFLMYIATYMYM